MASAAFKVGQAELKDKLRYLMARLTDYFNADKVLKYFVVDFDSEIEEASKMVSDHKDFKEFFDHLALYKPQKAQAC